MAILFNSPKNKRRFLFWSISVLVILSFGLIFITAFPPFSDQMTDNSSDVYVPNVKINFDAFNLKQVENLVPFGNAALDDKPATGRGDPFLPYY